MKKTPKKVARRHSTTRRTGKRKPKADGPLVAVVVPMPPAGVFSVLLADPLQNPFWRVIPDADKYFKSDGTTGLVFTAL